MKKILSFALALALMISLLSGFSVFAADNTGYPPVTMDTIIDEDYYGKQCIYENHVGNKTILTIPVREFFATGCVGSAESSGWLTFTNKNERGQPTNKLSVGGKSEYEYNGRLLGGWELKDGVCLIDGNHSGYLSMYNKIPIKALPIRGNAYVKTIVIFDAYYNQAAVNYVNKDYYPNLETVFIFGDMRKFDGVTTISSQQTKHSPDNTHDIMVSYSDGTSVSDVIPDGACISAGSPLYEAFSKLHVVMNQKTFKQIADKQKAGYQRTGAFDCFKDLINWESFPTTPDMGITQPTPTPTPVIDNNTKLSDWAKDRIEQAFKLDIAKADWNGKDLTKPVTRMEFCIIAMEIFQTATNGTPDTSKKNSFTDITANADAINGAYNLGIISGYDSHTFGPNDYISREQAATMLGRLAKACGKAMPSGTNPFTDAISSWALDGVSRCYAAGIMKGVGDKTFDANGLYTAEQSIVSNMRLYDYLVK